MAAASSSAAAVPRSGAKFIQLNLGLAGFGAGHSPLCQAVKELLDNSIDAGALNIRVNVTVRGDECEGQEYSATASSDSKSRLCTITVEDNGCGLPSDSVAETLCRVFSTTKESDGGGGGEMLGRHGIGIKAAVLYAQTCEQTATLPLRVITTRRGDADSCSQRLGLDATSGSPVVADVLFFRKHDEAWQGTLMELELEDFEQALPRLVAFFHRMAVLPAGRAAVDFCLQIAAPPEANVWGDNDGLSGDSTQWRAHGSSGAMVRSFSGSQSSAHGNRGVSGASAGATSKRKKAAALHDVKQMPVMQLLQEGPLRVHVPDISSVIESCSAERSREPRMRAESSVVGFSSDTHADELFAAAAEDREDNCEFESAGAAVEVEPLEALSQRLQSHYGVPPFCVANGAASSLLPADEDGGGLQATLVATVFIILAPFTSPDQSSKRSTSRKPVNSGWSAFAHHGAGSEATSIGTSSSGTHSGLSSSSRARRRFAMHTAKPKSIHGAINFDDFDFEEAGEDSQLNPVIGLGEDEAMEWAVASSSSSSSSAGVEAFQHAAAHANRPFSCGHVLRFVNGIPLLRNAAGCSISQAVLHDVPWHEFGLAVAPFASASILRTSNGTFSKRNLDILRRSAACSDTSAAPMIDMHDVDSDGIIVLCNACGSEPLVQFDSMRVIVDVRRAVTETDTQQDGDESAQAPAATAGGGPALVFGDLAKTFLHNNCAYRSVVSDATMSALKQLQSQLPGLLLAPSELQRQNLMVKYIPDISRLLCSTVRTAFAEGRPLGQEALALADVDSVEALHDVLLRKLKLHTEVTLAVQAEAQDERSGNGRVNTAATATAQRCESSSTLADSRESDEERDLNRYELDFEIEQHLHEAAIDDDAAAIDNDFWENLLDSDRANTAAAAAEAIRTDVDDEFSLAEQAIALSRSEMARKKSQAARDADEFDAAEREAATMRAFDRKERTRIIPVGSRLPAAGRRGAVTSSSISSSLADEFARAEQETAMMARTVESNPTSRSNTKQSSKKRRTY